MNRLTEAQRLDGGMYGEFTPISIGASTAFPDWTHTHQLLADFAVQTWGSADADWIREFVAGRTALAQEGGRNDE